MIYIKYDNNGYVTMQHYMPFDEQHGLGKTREELEQEGVFVESIPEPEVIEGKEAVLKYNETNGLYYEYVDRPLTSEEELRKLKTENEELKARVEATEEALFTIMFGNV